MKSLLLSLMMLLSPFSFNVDEEVFVVSPTSLYAEASYSSQVVCQLDYNDSLIVLQDAENGFLKVKVNENDLNVQGYVQADLVAKKSEAQDVILSYNATMLEDAEVFSVTDDQQIGQIKKGTRVLLTNGYDKDTDFLQIKYAADGKIVLGRVKTEFVKPDGVNAALIVSITAIVALVTIIIILFGITKKKRHKKLKNE